MTLFYPLSVDPGGPPFPLVVVEEIVPFQEPPLHDAESAQDKTDQGRRLDIIHGDPAGGADLSAGDRGLQITPGKGDQIDKKDKLDRQIQNFEQGSPFFGKLKSNISV